MHQNVETGHRVLTKCWCHRVPRLPTSPDPRKTWKRRQMEAKWKGKGHITVVESTEA